MELLQVEVYETHVIPDDVRRAIEKAEAAYLETKGRPAGFAEATDACGSLAAVREGRRALREGVAAAVVMASAAARESAAWNHFLSFVNDVEALVAAP